MRRLTALLPAVVPEPETAAFSRAVLGVGRRHPEWLSLVAEVVGLAVLLTGALLGQPLLAVGGFGVAGAADALASRGADRWPRLLDVVGATAPVRAVLRSAPLVAVLPRAYVVLVIAILGSLVVGAAATQWLAMGQPVLAYAAGSARQDADSLRFARAYRRAVGVPWSLLATEGATIVALLLSGDAAAGGIVALGVLVAVGIAGAALFAARRLRAERAAIQERVLARLDALNPIALVHVSGGQGMSRYLVNQWLGALEALPEPPVLVAREASQLAPIAPTGLPLVYAPQPRHVEALIRPTMRIAFFVANGPKNTDLWRDRRVRHVFLGHGDSDKATSATPLAKVYDQVWVAGQAGIDRYRDAGVEVNPESFVIIGRPQVAGLSVGPLHHRPVILYAPTFEGYYEESNYSSLALMGPALIRRLLTVLPQASIWFKPHPATGVQNPALLRAREEVNALLASAGGQHRCLDEAPAETILDCFEQADVLISDVSSITSDFLATERPFVVTNPRDLDADTFRARFPAQSAAYLVAPTLDNLDEVMADALGDDSLAETRRALKRHVLGDLPEGPVAAFVAATARLAAS